MKVLVIPEDPVRDRYILKPLVERLLSDLGRTGSVDVLTNPRMRGVAQALDRSTLDDVVQTYRMIDLFLVLVDRDGDRARHELARAREQDHPGKLLVCLAIEEIEVWMLALHREKLAAPWTEVRSEVHPKDRFAEIVLREHAPKGAPGNGRAWAMKDLGGNLRSLLGVCEELAELRARISTVLGRE